MQIKLVSENKITQEQVEQVFNLPIAIGRDLSELPPNLNNEPVSPIVLLDNNRQISRFHAQIRLNNNRVYLEDQSSNGTKVNGKLLVKQGQVLNTGDTIVIGGYTITVVILEGGGQDEGTVIVGDAATVFNFDPQSQVLPASRLEPIPNVASSISFNPHTGILEQQVSSSPSISRSEFPYNLSFWHRPQISLREIESSGFLVRETEYLACGGGMGSFVWVDMLRIAGVKTENIKILSNQEKPYQRYKTLLKNCQISEDKRIRSGSDSCPDNIWGWPGYGLRDAKKALFSGQIGAAIGFLWQVFAEPVYADTYTPIAGDVFDSMDRESERINWQKMLEPGAILSLRQTEDGRYCIAYCSDPQNRRHYQFLLARYVHICTGYPGLKLLPDLEKYRQEYPQETGNSRTVVQGYEEHDHIYTHLEKHGGTLILRGSGIVASQVLDRIYQARKRNKNIDVIHLNRNPRSGNRFEKSQRYVENDWEFQPYNWPKATWGGDMRKLLEASEPFKRRELLDLWGGTTTASRKQWRKIVQEGKQQGWYKLYYGLADKIQRGSEGKIVASLVTNEGYKEIKANFVIDCTGLISDPLQSPFLKDLINHYDLDLNPDRRLYVKNNFEIRQLRHPRDSQSRVYAAGIITLGGPYAPVDTFLGLQYAAHRSVEALAAIKAPGVRYIQGIYSVWQWFKWALNLKP